MALVDPVSRRPIAVQPASIAPRLLDLPPNPTAVRADDRQPAVRLDAEPAALTWTIAGRQAAPVSSQEMVLAASLGVTHQPPASMAAGYRFGQGQAEIWFRASDPAAADRAVRQLQGRWAAARQDQADAAKRVNAAREKLADLERSLAGAQAALANAAGELARVEVVRGIATKNADLAALETAARDQRAADEAQVKARERVEQITSLMPEARRLLDDAEAASRQAGERAAAAQQERQRLHQQARRAIEQVMQDHLAVLLATL